MSGNAKKPELIKFALKSLYGVILVATMTHAPVAKLWLDFMFSGESNDSPMQAFEAWVVVIHVPAIISVFNRIVRGPLRRSPSTTLVLIFFFMMLASVTWSELPGRSFWDLTVISLSTFGALFIALIRNTKSFVAIIFVGVQIPISLSLWSISRGWAGAVDQYPGYWLGIFQNRNTLAPIAAVGALAALVLLVSLQPRKRSLVLLPTLALIGSADVGVLIKTGSVTNAFGAGVAVLGFVLWTMFKLMAGRPNIQRTTVSHVFGSTIVGMLLFLVFLMSVLADQISTFLGRSDGLSGRIFYWETSIEAILSRPIFGWGWNAAWLSSDFQKQFANQNFEFRWSHSFWLEAGLGAGVVAFIVVLSWAVIGVYRSARLSLGHRDQIWTVVFPCFACVLLTMESINWIAHWVFSLLVATFFIADSRMNDASGGETVGNLSDEVVSAG